MTGDELGQQLHAVMVRAVACEAERSAYQTWKETPLEDRDVMIFMAEAFASIVTAPLRAALADRDAEVARLRAILRYIREQADEHIGGEPYLVSPGAFYKIDAALAGQPAATPGPPAALRPAEQPIVVS